MASLKFHFRHSSKEGRAAGSIFIRIIHERRYCNFSTGVRVYPGEWDGATAKIILPDTADPRYETLLKAGDTLAITARQLYQIIDALEEGGFYTVEDVAGCFRRRMNGRTLSAFVGTTTRVLENSGQERLARAYLSMVRSVSAFTGRPDTPLETINGKFVRDYENFLKEKGCSMNTVSFYMRNLRAVLNRAVKEKLIPAPQVNIFLGVYTGVKTTRKRAINSLQLASMRMLDPGLTGNQMPKAKEMQLEDGMRDCLAMFLFCFYAQGMSFVDLAYLRKDNISRGLLSYRRKKTGQPIEIRLLPEMRSIISYFSGRTSGSPYIFPVLVPDGDSLRKQYESGLRLQNIRLKKLAAAAGIERNISTHVARHTWATVAKNINLPIAVISDCLGHTSENITRIYLDSFEREVLDKANEKISRAIKEAI